MPDAPAPAPVPLDRSAFAADAVTVAQALIGTTLLVDGVGGVVVETEAYDCEDPASHAFNGPTPRNAPMFGPIGHAYVYRSYGLHWCLNLVCDASQLGSAVLIRAIAPTEGIAIMRDRRGLEALRLLCAGPGRLAQALAVTGAMTGLPLDAPPFRLLPRTEAEPAIAVGPRIGLTRGVATPWRFGLAGSPFLSKPFR
ncbi:DNA-3-methyladenine glycosylase [Inquilinus sp.]|jgi:DNA-3-methyladenine glycosylase|uniref:DNA-3-methyladenine glycosylase n=1 Tax=Inquilinus sp. TaxID=1932117 RepID=UPI003782E576